LAERRSTQTFKHAHGQNQHQHMTEVNRIREPAKRQNRPPLQRSADHARADCAGLIEGQEHRGPDHKRQ
jgi:hypothetical protein